MTYVNAKNHFNLFSPSGRSQITSCYCYIHCELCYARQLLSRTAQRREEQKEARWSNLRVSDDLPSVIEVSYQPPGEEADFYEYKLAKWIISLSKEQEDSI